MKNIKAVVATMCALLSMQAYAVSDEQIKQCKMLGKFGENVLDARYDGVRLSEILALRPSPVLEEIILLAYRTPNYVTQESRSMSKQNFSNEIESACFKGK